MKRALYWLGGIGAAAVLAFGLNQMRGDSPRIIKTYTENGREVTLLDLDGNPATTEQRMTRGRFPAYGSEPPVGGYTEKREFEPPVEKDGRKANTEISFYDANENRVEGPIRTLESREGRLEVPEESPKDFSTSEISEDELRNVFSHVLDVVAKSHPVYSGHFKRLDPDSAGIDFWPRGNDYIFRIKGVHTDGMTGILRLVKPDSDSDEIRFIYSEHKCIGEQIEHGKCVGGYSKQNDESLVVIRQRDGSDIYTPLEEKDEKESISGLGRVIKDIYGDIEKKLEDLRRDEDLDDPRVR